MINDPTRILSLRCPWKILQDPAKIPSLQDPEESVLTRETSQAWIRNFLDPVNYLERNSTCFYSTFFFNSVKSLWKKNWSRKRASFLIAWATHWPHFQALYAGNTFTEIQNSSGKVEDKYLFKPSWKLVPSGKVITIREWFHFCCLLYNISNTTIPRIPDSHI